MPDEKTPRELLIELAQELAGAREDLEAARRREAELKAPYEAAYELRERERKRVVRIEQGMEVLKVAYAITVSLNEMGIVTEHPPLIAVHVNHRDLAEIWKLAAIGSEGTPLYLMQPEQSHRYQGKEYALRADEPPDLDLYVPDRLRSHGLFPWWTRGKDAWGHTGRNSSGSIKPKPPPEGGRWRWIKVVEQPQLEAVTADA